MTRPLMTVKDQRGDSGADEPSVGRPRRNLQAADMARRTLSRTQSATPVHVGGDARLVVVEALAVVDRGGQSDRPT
jgi:hypothetical protein